MTVLLSVFSLTLLICFALSLALSIRLFGIASTPSLFLYSLALFQVIPVLYGLYTGYYQYDLTRQINMLSVGIVAFTIGYLPFGLARRRLLKKTVSGLSPKESRTVFKAALYFSLLLFPITATLAVQFFLSRRGGQYGLTEPISSLEQLFFYAALSFFCLALSVNLKHIPLKWILLLVAIVLLPRLLVSLVYSRIFIFLALVPLLYSLYFSRLNYKLSPSKATVAFGVLALFVILPALTRDTSIVASQQRFEALVMNGSSIPILEKYEQYDIQRNQSYVFASVILKAIPFSIPLPENYRVNVWGIEGAVATLDRVLSSYENQAREDLFYGTGSNYLHELYIDFGWLGVIVGSILVALVASYMEYKGVQSLFFRFIWLSVLTSFLFLPRSNVGYFVEKLPLYIAFYLLAWFAIKLLKESTEATKTTYAKTQSNHNLQ
ncbi:MAG: hypothetical protein KatS3mg070_1657 [Meiothermus sp.]|uniref:O-antigen polysaccharide polymerase Wzy n=1 Tax=Meiothermus sp. TaxID=1955249 RepID=UPI0021DD8218|nr:O-antigen polysaccharide polymerase Wzy [Meiothermus sp.]GIW28294.1 MAG: hypothetical protein KatS3mg070_1657 [Meiothermus sp.]